jgi:formylglycine-generating enzyme required for sulfatase activity
MYLPPLRRAASTAEPLRAGSYPLAAPGVGALHEMITRPAARAGLSFEDELPARILDDTGGEPGALPLMAFALEQLYGQRSAEGKLTHAAYEAFGGVKGAISRRAEETYAGLRPAAQATLAAVFRELVEVDLTDAGWVATRQRAELHKVAATPEARELVSAFQGARLLQQSKGEHDLPVVEVAHEALLRNWPRLTGWIQKTGEDLAVLHQLRRAAQEWQAQGRRGDLRWPRRRWKQAERVIDRLQVGNLDEPAPSFLAASRRGTRRLTGALGLGLAALVLAGWVALFTYTSGEGNFKYSLDVLRDRVLYAVGALEIHEPEMIWLRPGEDAFPRSFQMGSGDEDQDAADSEKPRHEVAFSRRFAVGKYEVTFDQYADFVRRAGATEPFDHSSGRGRRPVINVSWGDATRYAHWLSLVTGKAYRLPSEAEWEYAARGGSQGRYWWCPADQPSCDIPPDMANCSGCKSTKGLKGIGKQTLPVGSFPANGFDLCDTVGNVYEWAQDCWHGSYTGDPPKDGAAWGKEWGGDCGRRVLRGGSWPNLPALLRSAYRSGSYAVYRYNYIGFRLAQGPLTLCTLFSYPLRGSRGQSPQVARIFAGRRLAFSSASSPRERLQR